MKSIIHICTLLLTLFMIGITIGSCKKDKDTVTDPPDENQEELITTVKISLVDSADASNQTSATFKDPDGDGGNAPTVFDTLQLMPGKVYFAAILLLNESDPAKVDTISNEVLEEAADHQFFFHLTGVNVHISYRDKDKNNLPLGLNTRWKTDAASQGTCKVILKHQPGIKNGTEAPGETDVEITFKAIVQ